MVLASRRSLLTAAFGTVAVGAVAAPEAANAASPAGTDLVLNARDRGAVGDGVTDDAGALNRAVTELAKQGGGVLQLPRGTYLVQSPVVLQSGVSIVSAAAGHGYIAATRAAAVVIAAGSSLTGAVIDTGTDAVVAAGISGIDIQGNAASAGVRLRNASWCVVERSSINGCGDEGVLIGSGMACVLEDLLVTNCLLDHTRSAVAGTIDVDGTDHYLSRCEASASLKAKTSADKRVAAVVVRGANHFVSDSVGEYADVGWVVAASSTRFSNVRGDTNQGDGFQITGGANVFAACSSVGNSQDATGVDDGWVVSGGSNSFAACNVVTSSSKQVRYGFNDTVNTRAASARNTYSGCIVDQAADALWQTEGFLGSSPAVATHPIRPADGTTAIDVAQASVVVLFDYASPTVVSDFVNGVNGQTIRVLGNPVVTIAASKRIATAGGLPLVLTAGRATAFTLYDGRWYQGD